MEELGLALPIGRLLAMEWVQAEDDPHGGLMFAYDGGVVDAATVARFRLPPDELSKFRFVDPGALPEFASSSMSGRIAAALAALADGTVVEIDRT